MIARYNGSCPRCSWFYIKGSEIEKVNDRWRPVDCPGCQQMTLAHRLVRRVRDTHRIAMVIDLTPGIRMTETRREFLEAVIRLGAATDEEITAFRRHYSGMMERSLYD